MTWGKDLRKIDQWGKQGIGGQIMLLQTHLVRRLTYEWFWVATGRIGRTGEVWSGRSWAQEPGVIIE